MTEILFKLKKSGKCVGFLKYFLPAEGGVMLSWWRANDSDPWLSADAFCVQNEGWDEMCPFVDKDRKGRPVFAGDSVRIYYAGGPMLVDWDPVQGAFLHYLEGDRKGCSIRYREWRYVLELVKDQP